QGSLSSSGAGVSADGSVVVGGSTSASTVLAFRWVAGQGMQNLGIPGPNGTSSRASGVSADGAVVYGSAHFPPGVNRAFRWSAGRGIEDLGTSGPDRVHSDPQGCNADGSRMAINCFAPQPPRGYLWTREGGFLDLGVLPGLDFVFARAMSGDG